MRTVFLSAIAAAGVVAASYGTAYAQRGVDVQGPDTTTPTTIAPTTFGQVRACTATPETGTSWLNNLTKAVELW